ASMDEIRPCSSVRSTRDHLSYVSRRILYDSPLSFVVFFWYGPHRYLHSFPTRRSSDLASTAQTLEGMPTMARTNTKTPEQRNARSEEHTSELQSHLNLVCRLLLEKKKIEKPKIESKAKMPEMQTNRKRLRNTDTVDIYR